MKGRETDSRLHLQFIKSYKKNTLAIFLSFALTFTLLTAMLVLLHTNHRIANIQAKAQFTPSDCYIGPVRTASSAVERGQEYSAAGSGAGRALYVSAQPSDHVSRQGG